MSDDIDAQVESRVSEVWQGVYDAEHRAEGARRAATVIEEIRESAESATGVWVEVDSVGRVAGLRFSPSALTLSPDRLAAEVLDTIVRARQLAGRKAVDAALDGFGASDALLGRLESVYMPKPPPVPEPPASPYRGPILFS